jgi:RNA polymerase sigma-70 factor (ECF subfamily)
MERNDWLAERFEAHRSHLHGVARRMLGSPGEADDAVQEAWVRLSRADARDIDNLGGWLTTVVARVCLDQLRSRKAKSEQALESDMPTATGHRAPRDPEADALIADSVGIAMLVVLERLTPAERVAFVLHDMFDVPFDDIAPIVDRSPEATRQLASRARRRVRQADAPDTAADRKRQVITAFLAASRHGDFDALLALLDPDIVLRADPAAIRFGAVTARGADAVARTFAGRAQAARPAFIEGDTALLWAPGGKPKVLFEFTVIDGRITGLELVADPDRLSAMEPDWLDD